MGRAATSDFDVPGLKGELMPFQRAGVEAMDQAGRFILGDDMGLGKTIQILAYLQLHPEKRPAVVICPAVMKAKWRLEALDWLTTDEQIVILSGTTPDASVLEGATLVILNWDILASWLEPLMQIKPQVVAGDEAQAVLNPQSNRGRAFRKLVKTVPHVFPVTGTPMMNRPKELWQLLHIVAPEAWPTFFPFGRRYCNAYHNGWGWDFDGASNLDELHEMVKPYVIRRTKLEVLTELPAKRRAVVPLEVSDRDRKAYNLVLAEMADLLSNEELDLYGRTNAIGGLNRAAAAAKLDAALDWVESFLESGEKLVLFAIHKAIVRRVMERFGDVAVKITGDTPAAKRQDIVDRFQTDDEIRLFVGNIDAAGTGITLTAASNVAFLEFAWRPGDHDQAEDRCNRIGQTNAVTAWYLVMQDSVDGAHLALVLDYKRQNIETVMEGSPGKLSFETIKMLSAAILEQAKALRKD